MDVVLRLVRRSATSTLAMPRESPDAVAKGDHIPWFHAAEVMDYAHIMKGGEDYMAEQFDKDIAAIKDLEHHDEIMFGEDSEWTTRAIKMLTEAKEKVAGMGNPPPFEKQPEEPKPKRAPIVFNTDTTDVPEMYNVQQVTRSGQSLAEPASADHAAPTQPTVQEMRSGTSPDTTRSMLTTRLADFKARQHVDRQPDHYHFYQALLHYYLSPLDIRILKEAFGAYEAFPSSILPRVERVSHGHVVDDELRKRVKYLGHLPHGCEVGFLECDWTDTVPPAILEKYKPDLDKRRKRNHDKEAREEKERLRAERAEDKEFAAARRRRLNLSADKFRADDFQPLTSGTNTPGAAAADGNLSASDSTPPWIGGSHRNNSSGFATLASPGTSPNAVRTVWGTTAVGLSSPELHALVKEEPADDGWLQDWEKDLLDHQEEELMARMAATTMNGEGASNGASTPSAGGGGKGKKKGKKITLMSTNARRGA